MIAAPVLKSFIILVIIKVSGALGSICGERQMMKCVEYILTTSFCQLDKTLKTDYSIHKPPDLDRQIFHKFSLIRWFKKPQALFPESVIL